MTGNKNEGILSSVEVYSNVTNQFSYVSAMKIPRSFFGCCLVNSKIYALGGESNTVGNRVGYINEVEIYDSFEGRKESIKGYMPRI